MTKVNISDLKPGMILAEDIESLQNGVILISKGTILNKKIIKRIFEKSIEYVFIYDQDDDQDSDQDSAQDDDSKTIPKSNFVERYEALSDKMENVFTNVKFGKEIVLEEISEEIDDLIVEVIQNNNILGRIRQLEQEDDYTFNHGLNVSMLVTMIGKWLGYSDENIKQLAITGLFHDIGKLKIDDNILHKPGKLTESEFEIMKKHPIHGYDILSETTGISKNVLLGVLQHHEREDGSGYPNGVKGDEIHEYAKIIAVCDVYDALTSNREYKDKISPFHAAEILEEQSFTVLDPKIARIFLDKIANFYAGCRVLLSNREEGEIVYVHPQSPTKVIVKVGDKYINFLEPQDIYIVDIIE